MSALAKLRYSFLFLLCTVMLTLAMAAPAQQQREPPDLNSKSSQARSPSQQATPAPSAVSPQPQADPQEPNSPSGPPDAQRTPAAEKAQPTPGDEQPNVSPSTSAKQRLGKRTKQSQSQPETSEEPLQPKTEILDSSGTSGGVADSGHDPILDPPPFPSGPTTMVGGIIRRVDRIRNRIVLAVFGGEPWTIFFDERTHIFENGAETTELALKKGERAYVDTMLDEGNHNILARNIRLGVSPVPADADGMVERVDRNRGELTVRDRINSVPVNFSVNAATRISNGTNPVRLADLRPGTLVRVKFTAQSGYHGVAREIAIIALPGTVFRFAGQITYLDMHRGLLAIRNRIDDKTYDIRFSPNRLPDARNLGVGQEVTVMATFDGPQYTAQSVTIPGGAK